MVLQVIIYPPTGPESAIFLFWPKLREEIEVIYMEALEAICYPPQSSTEARPPVAVQKWATPIEYSVSEVVRAAFAREMLRARFREESVFRLHPIRYEITVLLIGSGLACGKLYVPRDGSSTQHLVRLAKLLEQFARAEPADREPLVAKLLTLSKAVP